MAGGKKRGFLMIVVLFVCLAIFGSFLFIFCGADHDCTHGDDCEVCRAIDICVHAVRFAAVVVAVALMFVCAAVTVIFVNTHRGEMPAATLISLKTELRN